MEITWFSEAIQRDAIWAVFLNVLLQQLGLPLPAIPTLMIAGSLALSFGHAGKVLAMAVLASVIADWIWYMAGRMFGYRVLGGLCRLSINPGSCVSQTEVRFTRWGVWSLVIAKFVPGFSIVAPPIAGSLRMPLRSFLVAASLGATFWAGAAILTGWLLRAELQTVIAALGRNGTVVGIVALLALAVSLGWKLWQKHRFEQQATIPHISPAELILALRSDHPPLLLDLRSTSMIAETGAVEGATVAQLEGLLNAVDQWPKNGQIVTLCACPGDATAVRAAHNLTQLGYTSVRPLKGGYDAWGKAHKPM